MLVGLSGQILALIRQSAAAPFVKLRTKGAAI